MSVCLRDHHIEKGAGYSECLQKAEQEAMGGTSLLVLVVYKSTCQCRRHGLIPGLGRSHILWGNKACAPQLLNPDSIRAHALQLESSPCSPQLEKAWAQQ